MCVTAASEPEDQQGQEASSAASSFPTATAQYPRYPQHSHQSLLRSRRKCQVRRSIIDCRQTFPPAYTYSKLEDRWQLRREMAGDRAAEPLRQHRWLLLNILFHLTFVASLSDRFDDEVPPDKDLNLDGMAPPTPVKVESEACEGQNSWKRISNTITRLECSFLVGGVNFVFQKANGEEPAFFGAQRRRKALSLLFREGMRIHSHKPQWVVDLAFFTPSWMAPWKYEDYPNRKGTPRPKRPGQRQQAGC